MKTESNTEQEGFKFTDTQILSIRLVNVFDIAMLIGNLAIAAYILTKLIIPL